VHVADSVQTATSGLSLDGEVPDPPALPSGDGLPGGATTYSFTVAPPACRADWNQSGDVNSADFFDFLNAFFASDPAADFNADSIVNSQDFFEFLAAFFAGC
jgi:hypothetical protein